MDPFKARFECFEPLGGQVIEEMHTNLEEPYTKEEMVAALHQMNPTEAWARMGLLSSIKSIGMQSVTPFLMFLSMLLSVGCSHLS